jgi:hypothetical protein
MCEKYAEFLYVKAKECVVTTVSEGVETLRDVAGWILQ